MFEHVKRLQADGALQAGAEHAVREIEEHVGAGKEALLFPSAADGDAHMAPSTLYQVDDPARKEGGLSGPALARPSPHRGRPRGPDWRHPGWARGSSRSLDPRCGDAWPARGG